MKTTKELADHVEARERLLKRGYTWHPCDRCRGLKREEVFLQGTQCVFDVPCIRCDGKGGHWQAPLKRL